ncbi:MAG: Gfo/Idh/MocA family oxidoreductase [Clostridia bacterium]|nr:Gfo/Idh/MocA family oxidoreductase [Clostridia bacterium]MBR2972651.1 Gfo/Idh/MocA family oxidoreductase [Clostridia bacterium]
MKKVRVGVIGAYRGNQMIKYCKRAEHAELVAICDKLEGALAKQKELDEEGKITFYTDFDEFLKHDMDAVVLANYATEHAPFAIKALKAGKHVYSEVLPCQTMKEAVELIETIEETGLIYSYGENYCYMAAPYEMRKLYREGKIGEFEYGECEYIHNCENRWHSLTYGDKDHWRNNVYATFYCTHSVGPIIHITGLRPVSVVGFEGRKNERKTSGGAKTGQFGIEMIELENGGIIKSIHGDLYKNSIWYSIYGSKGRMESAREDAKLGLPATNIYVNADETPGAYGEEKIDAYLPVNDLSEVSKQYGHGGSDFYSMYNFIEKIKGDENADTIDIFEALDMFLPGMFAYRSILAGGITVEIPNLRNKEERDKWRNDTTCTDPKVAGDMLIPSFSLGNPDIPDAVYEKMAKMWDEECQGENDYVSNK